MGGCEREGGSCFAVISHPIKFLCALLLSHNVFLNMSLLFAICVYITVETKFLHQQANVTFLVVCRDSWHSCIKS